MKEESDALNRAAGKAERFHLKNGYSFVATADAWEDILVQRTTSECDKILIALPTLVRTNNVEFYIVAND